MPWHDADFIDVLWAYMLREFPQIAGPRLDQVKRAVRHEFGGTEVWVSPNTRDQRRATAAEVLRLFNGRNATEVARELGISRASVYRYIKQAGRPA